jgi:hypothetical protein
MPDYTTPRDWSDYELVRAGYLNTDVRDNFLFLKTPPFNNVTINAIVTTTSTSFVELTGATMTVTSQGGRMLIAACGVSSNSSAGATVTFDLAIDGTRVGNATTGLTAQQSPIANYPDNISAVHITDTAPSAGSHTYSVHWKVSSGTGSTITRLFAIEIAAEHTSQTWTTPKTWADEEFVDAAELNTHLRDNSDWLRARPFISNIIASTTTTSTSFAKLTNSDTTLDSDGGYVMIIANGVSSNSSSAVTYYDLAIDGTRVGDATNGLMFITNHVANYKDSVGMVWFTQTAPSVGNHTYSVYWKVNTGTATGLITVYAIEIR